MPSQKMFGCLSLGFSLDFLWNFQGFCWGSKICCWFFLFWGWIFHGWGWGFNWFPLGFPGFSIVFLPWFSLGFPRFSLHFPWDSLWVFLGFFGVFLVSLVFPWFSWVIHGTINGFPIVFLPLPCVFVGFLWIFLTKTDDANLRSNKPSSHFSCKLLKSPKKSYEIWICLSSLEKMKIFHPPKKNSKAKQNITLSKLRKTGEKNCCRR